MKKISLFYMGWRESQNFESVVWTDKEAKNLLPTLWYGCVLGTNIQEE